MVFVSLYLLGNRKKKVPSIFRDGWSTSLFSVLHRKRIKIEQMQSKWDYICYLLYSPLLERGGSVTVSFVVPSGTFFFLQYPDGYPETEVIMPCQRPLILLPKNQALNRHFKSMGIHTSCSFMHLWLTVHPEWSLPQIQLVQSYLFKYILESRGGKTMTWLPFLRAFLEREHIFPSMGMLFV